MITRIVEHANADRPNYGSAERITFDENIASELYEAKALKGSLQSISRSISQFPKAHEEIRNLLTKQNTSVEALTALVQESQRASKFYRDLK